MVTKIFDLMASKSMILEDLQLQLSIIEPEPLDHSKPRILEILVISYIVNLSKLHMSIKAFLNESTHFRNSNFMFDGQDILVQTQQDMYDLRKLCLTDKSLRKIPIPKMNEDGLLVDRLDENFNALVKKVLIHMKRSKMPLIRKTV